MRILDFGLARLVTSELTRSNIVVGTMNYMAPEQGRGDPSDQRADIFALGVVFYELLCGRKAFESRLVRRDDVQGAAGASRAPFHRGPRCGAQVISAIVDGAIEKDREHRYQSMGDMLRDLEEVRAALPPASQIPVPGGISVLSQSEARA